MEKCITNKDLVSTDILADREGMKFLNRRLVESNGSAAIIVHPYFPENHSYYRRGNYERYLERLNKSVIRYKRMHYPIIIMEEIPINYYIGEVLRRLNINSGEIYTVETRISDPAPSKISLSDLAKSLKDHGLKKAVVNGTYFWLDKRRSDYPYRSIHPLRHKYRWSGCVGATLNAFINSGIYATPGFAAYPGRFENG